jgi:hypothetical protein
MSTNPVCPKCWYTNFAGAKFCTHCGTVLPTLPSAPSVTVSTDPQPTPSVSSTTDYYSYYLEGKKRDGVRNTRIGLLLLSIGTFLSLSSILGLLAGSPVPIFILALLGQIVIGFLGGIMNLLGVIFIILGREAFGRTHSNRVIWSVVLYIVGNVIGITSSFLYSFTTASLIVNSQATTGLQGQLVTSFFILLIGNLAGIAISGLGYVLLTFSIQEKTGLILLWIGYIASLAIALAAIVTVGYRAPSVIQMAVAPGTVDRATLLNLSSQFLSLTTLIAIPRAIFAFSYLLAWSTIGSRERETLVTYGR